MATRKRTSWIVWIMVGLIAVGFGGWFSGGAGGRTTSVGSVDGLPIPVQTYASALRNQLQAFSDQTGQPIDMAQAQALGLDRAVLGQVVAERALDAEAHRLGLSVGDARVARAVRAIPAFQSLDGSFDRAAYRESLRRNGLNEEAFETSLREDTTRTILQAAVLGGLPEPLAYGAALAAYNSERRSATWAPLATASIAIAPQATEEELRAYYEANPDLFTAPEVRSVSYAWLTPAMRRDDLPVDEDAVRALYDDRIDQFVQEERRLVERLVYPSEEAAQAARAQLDAGSADFQSLVAERGLQLSDTDLGDVARDDLGNAGDPVFSAAVGDVIGPVSTSLGPALFRVNAVLAADEVPFGEAAPELRSELADEAAREVIGDLRGQLEDLVAGGATVADIAERTDFEPGEIDFSEGLDEGPAAYAAFREGVLASEPGDLPQLVELDDGGLAVLAVGGVTPPALRPFEEARPEVQKAWQEQAIQAEALSRAQAAAEAIATGASFEEQGLAPRSEESIERRSAIEGTPPDFAETVFALQPGEARAIETADGAVVVRLDSVAAAAEDDENAAAERIAISQQVSGQIAQDLFQAFSAALQTGSEIRIDDRAVAAVNAQVN